MNAIRFPSGDQRGEVEDFSPRVIWRVSPVAALAAQICETKASSLKFAEVTEQAGVSNPLWACRV